MSRAIAPGIYKSTAEPGFPPPNPRRLIVLLTARLIPAHLLGIFALAGMLN